MANALVKSLEWLHKANSAVINVVNLTEVELTYFNPVNWRYSPNGNFTSNWIRIYTGDYKTIIDEVKGSPLVAKQKGLDIIDQVKSDFKAFPKTPEPIEQTYEDIILWGVSLSVSKSPAVTEQMILGRNMPIQLELSQSNFSFSLSFLESGPVFWQQNFRSIIRLQQLLFSGKPLKVFCPRLKQMYPEILDVILTDYNLTDGNTYANTSTNLSFTQADTENIFEINKELDAT